MIAPTQLKKPSNWQDFEKLCKLLWGEIWDCPDSIKRYGRQGQNQHGVDIYAYVEKYNGYCGIQCKCKDEYTHAQLKEDEIDEEIGKALAYEPPLKLLLFATTANKDEKIERYIRKKDVENRDKGLFKIDIASWEDIVDHLERYRETYNWYVNNCQFKDATDVSVTFDGEEEVVINPQYVKTTTRYVLKKLTPIEAMVSEHLQQLNVSFQPYSFPNLINGPVKVDKRWCKLHIHIENIGSTVIRSPKLKMYFRVEDIEDIDDRFRYCNTWGLNDAAKAQINTNKDANRELFQTYINEIEYKPKDTVFVQNDERNFTIAVLPKDGVKEFPLIWTFLCEDYKKSDALTIIVEPHIEEVEKVVEVTNDSDLKPDEVKIEPKIVEE